MNYTDASDEQLALALKAGDEPAFDELVRRHQGRVYALAYRVTLNREDALDVAQEALVKVYRNIGMWRPTSGFLPWLMRLTSNQAIDAVRRRRRHQHDSLDSAGSRPAVVAESGDDADTGARANEIEARVREAQAALSPAQRAVFAMRHYDGLQLAEIAEAMGCTVGSVKVHLFRALRKLQHELQDLMEKE